MWKWKMQIPNRNLCLLINMFNRYLKEWIKSVKFEYKIDEQSSIQSYCLQNGWNRQLVLLSSQLFFPC